MYRGIHNIIISNHNLFTLEIILSAIVLQKQRLHFKLIDLRLWWQLSLLRKRFAVYFPILNCINSFTCQEYNMGGVHFQFCLLGYGYALTSDGTCCWLCTMG